MRKNVVMWAGNEVYLSNWVSGGGARKIHVFDENIGLYLDIIKDYWWAYSKLPRPSHQAKKVEVKWKKH